uniref:F-box domain-containing protein n=1 Tax=Globisporangium ultimum (strain ATCC 200006 / CBS 805.95 / DAOM BR144) TaxID=431595 RepID=K3WMD7_GLOUD
MDALPGTLVAEILAFACAPALVPASPGGAACCTGGSDAYDFAKRITAPSAHALRSLASVSTTWRDAAAAIVADHKQRVFTLAFTVGNEERAQTQFEARLKQHGVRIRDLRVAITTPTQSLWWVLDEEEEGQQEASTLYGQWIEWERLLIHVPMLERLDLSGVPLHHFSVREILEVASLHCPHIQALVLPRKERVHADVVHATIDETCRVLYVALARWYNASERGGLRQLTVPNRDEYDRDRSSTRFLDAVTSFCPKIEYLDGWKRTYNDVRFIISDESWCAPRPSSDGATDVWTRFCATCVHLREFSWVVVPFADAYFTPFGNTSKPLLTHLQLTYNAKAPFRIRRSEYSTSGLCHVVQACPKLQVLDVILHRIQPSHAFVYLQLDEMIDPDVFNDEFLAALTSSCPLLERIEARP